MSSVFFFCNDLDLLHCVLDYRPQVPDGDEFAWVRDYPAGRSVTELEMHSAALHRPASASTSAFFYIRDSQFEADVPKMCRQDFVSESETARNK